MALERTRLAVTALVFLPPVVVFAQAAGMAGMQGQAFAPSPYSGMYGSMGNVYSPYYRQYHLYGMGGTQPLVGMSGMQGITYVPSPYSGMYGSMTIMSHTAKFEWSDDAEMTNSRISPASTTAPSTRTSSAIVRDASALATCGSSRSRRL